MNTVEFSPEDFKHKDLTDKIIKVFYRVYNAIGYGFPEKCYERAMMMELKEEGFTVQAQVPVKVYYKGEVVGEFYADIVVNNLVILELKTVQELLKEHAAQLLTYIRSTEIEVGLLMNFGHEPKVVRKAVDNEMKKNIHTHLSS